MLIQVILTIWLLALIFLTRKFRKENRLPQQRIFSIFLIIWVLPVHYLLRCLDLHFRHFRANYHILVDLSAGHVFFCLRRFGDLLSDDDLWQV